MKRVWLNLLLTPVWFIIAIAILHATGSYNEPLTIHLHHHLQNQGPTILLLGLLMTGAFLFWSAKKDGFNLFRTGWRIQNNIFLEIGGGVAMGIIMAILYFAFVAPIQEPLQNQFGDFVDPGKTAGILVQQPIIYFIVNVILAPFIEESLFRNYALRQLSYTYNRPTRILISSLAFGLFQISGGFWFLIMNALLVGLPFALVADYRKSIIWTFAAHTTLNILEFIYFAS